MLAEIQRSEIPFKIVTMNKRKGCNIYTQPIKSSSKEAVGTEREIEHTYFSTVTLQHVIFKELLSSNSFTKHRKG